MVLVWLPHHQDKEMPYTVTYKSWHSLNSTVRIRHCNIVNLGLVSTASCVYNPTISFAFAERILYFSWNGWTSREMKISNTRMSQNELKKSFVSACQSTRFISSICTFNIYMPMASDTVVIMGMGRYGHSCTHLIWYKCTLAHVKCATLKG